jgi:hypothetical protein
MADLTIRLPCTVSSAVKYSSLYLSTHIGPWDNLGVEISVETEEWSLRLGCSCSSESPDSFLPRWRSTLSILLLHFSTFSSLLFLLLLLPPSSLRGRYNFLCMSISRITSHFLDSIPSKVASSRSRCFALFALIPDCQASLH